MEKNNIEENIWKKHFMQSLSATQVHKTKEKDWENDERRNLKEGRVERGKS